jgi:hypothetical protein
MTREVGYLPRCAGGEPRRILVASKRESEGDSASEGQEELADADRLELARIVTARIEDLHLTRKELEKRSGVSVATIRVIERPKGPRKFSRTVLEAISEALEWSPGYLVRLAHKSSAEAPDPIVQAMLTALGPYLEKIDAISGLQADVAAIKKSLRIAVDAIHEVDDRMSVHLDPSQGSGERRNADGLAELPDVAEPEREG